jgi:zinc finger-containing ubiquitin peptidase 1
LESVHPEGESPFMVKDGFTPSEQLSGPHEPIESSEGHLEFVDCPRQNCGETIMLTELESHMSMHDIENGNEEQNVHQDSNPNKRIRASDSESEPKFDTRLPPALRNLAAHDSPISSSSSSRQAIAKAGWRELLNMPSSRAKVQMSLESKRPLRRLGVSLLACSYGSVTNLSIEI